jgi:hypothetical protein
MHDLSCETMVSRYTLRGALRQGMFASDPIPTPAVKPPAPMPDPNSPGALEAKRKTELDIMGRAGRSSTILTAPKDRGDYTGTKLGTAA